MAPEPAAGPDVVTSVSSGAAVGCDAVVGTAVGNGSSSLLQAITMAATSAPMISVTDLIRLIPRWPYKYRIFNVISPRKFRT
jgi:hypothetical protein